MSAHSDFAIPRLGALPEPGSDLLTPMLEGRTTGLVVPDVVGSDVREALVAQARSGGYPSCPARYYDGRAYGPSLILDGGPTEAYFRDADALSHVPVGGTDVEAVLVGVLERLGGGRSVRRAEVGGSRYASVGIRLVEGGAGVHLHCENETRGFPSMRALMTTLGPGSILSFYVPLVVPSTGGQLEVFPWRHGEASGEPLTRSERSPEALGEMAESATPVVPDVRAGDLLIFDAGRHFHRVQTVGPGEQRWTLGGFVARGADDTLRFWN